MTLYGPKNESNVFINDRSKHIELRGVTKQNEGQYLITVSNPYGTATDYFHIKVLEAPGPKIVFPQSTVRTQEGASLQLEPKLKYVGRPFFTWTGPTGGSLIENAQQSGPVLYIPKVTKRNQGTYTLILMDQTGTTSAQINLVVEDTHKPTRKPHSRVPFHIVENTVIALEPNETAVFVCYLKPEIKSPDALVFHSWSKAAGKFERNIRPNIEILQIIRFKPSNVGDYKCTVVTSEGAKIEATVTLKLKEPGVEAEPEPTEPTEPSTTKAVVPDIPVTARIVDKVKNVTVGDNFQIECLTTGEQVSVVWLLNEQQIQDGQHQLYPRDNVLHVRNAQKEIGGYLICRAVAEDGRHAQDSMLVNVMEPQAPIEQEQQDQEPESPSRGVEITPDSVTPTVGDQVRLICKSNSKIVAWTSQDRSLSDNSEISADKSVLTIRNVQESDSGIYTCETVDGDRAYATVLVLAGAYNEEEAGQEALSVDVQPEEANLVQGREAQFECVVQGGASPIVVWRRIGGLLDLTRHIVRGHKLSIVNVQPEDRGYFECQADSRMESARDYVRVNVEAREAPRVEVYPQEPEVSVEYGGVVYAQCRVTAGVPTPSIKWKRLDGRPLSKNVVISQEGTLLQVQEAGDEEFGTYLCEAENIEGTDEGKIKIVSRGDSPSNEAEQQAEAEAQRIKQELEEERRRQEEEQQRPRPTEPVEDGGKPNVLVESVVEVQEGQEVTLNCRTTNRSPHQIYWRNPSGDYLETNPDGSVVIQNVQRANAGVYSCIINNRFGNAEKETELKVNFYEEKQPIRVELVPKSRSVQEGQSVEFKCNLHNQGETEVVYQWSRQGGAELPTDHMIRGNILRLNKVHKNDGGRYQCGVVYDGNFVYDDSYLEVVGENSNAFPVYIQVKERPIEANPNHALIGAFRFGVRMTVDCVAQTDTDEIVDVEWSKQEGYADRAKHNKAPNMNTLTIDALLPMDLGTYVCIASKNNGEKAQNEITFENHADHGAFFKYKIKGPSETVIFEKETNEEEATAPSTVNTAPTVKLLGENQLNKREGESCEFVCQVGGSPKPTLSWYNGNSEPIVENERLLINDNVLIINNLKSKDAGYYVCQAENSVGSNRAYIYLDVEPQEPTESVVRTTTQLPVNGKKPFVYMKSLNTENINVGETLTIACLVSDPEATVLFYKLEGDQTPLASTQRDKHIYELVFNPFTGQDAGQYKCYARNKHGDTEDVARIEHELDGSFSFSTDNFKSSSVAINTFGSLMQGNIVELKAELTRSHMFRRLRRQVEQQDVEYFSWIRYPNMPRSFAAEDNRLFIRDFDVNTDNGIYFVRATTRDRDFYGSKLIASNEYLLGENPYFSIEREDTETIVVRCRPCE